MCGRAAAIGVAAIALLGFCLARRGVADPQDPATTDVRRIRTQGGRFIEEGTGRPFTPVGFNFVRLRPRTPGMIAHATFDDGYYDADTVENLFEDLSRHGFSAVRVFIDPTSPGVGLFESPEAERLSPTYMANVLDFLSRARRHGVYVIPTFSMWGPNSTWLARGPLAKPMVSGANRLYFIESAADTRAAMLSEFVAAIKAHDPGLLPVVFAYELQNELCYFVGEEPLSLTEGQFPFLGDEYDIASEDELQRLMDDVSVHWVNTGVAAVREVDPDAMVSISLFTYRAVGRSGPNALRSDETRDGRVPARPLALIDSDASYLDLHMYPGSDPEAHSATDLESVEFAALKQRAGELGKPIIVGEFGAFNAEWAFPDRAGVPRKMREYVGLLRGLGFSGALYWTYDSPTPAPERKHIWDAKDGDGRIFQALVGAWSAEGFVRAEGTQLMLDGRPYRAIGVNVPHLSQGYMGTWFHWKQIYGTRERMREAIVEGVEDAARSKVAFIRFFASPGYPKGTAELYLADPDEYWRQMDEVFDLCRQHNVKLVPSLTVLGKWNLDYGEPRTAVLDPESKTHEATYQYVKEFVSRYADDPIVLMWELGNEHFLLADVDMEGRPAPGRGIYPEDAGAVRETYARDDSFTFDMLVEFHKEITAYIKSLDPKHLVTSGDSGPREESTSRRETFPDFRFRTDTLREHLSNLLESQPEPLDVCSVHMYGNFTTRRKVGDLPHLDFLRHRVRAMHAANRPAFVGELGQTNPYMQEDAEAKWTRAAIDLLDEEGVALIAIWVWHFPWQEKDFNIPSSDAQPLLMRRIAEFNDKHARLDD